MVSKNNHQFYQQKHAERKQRWGVRKLSVGVASVLLGTTFMLYSNHAVLADTVTNPSDVTSAQEGNKGTVPEGTSSTSQTGGDSTAPDEGQGKALTGPQANGQKENQQVSDDQAEKAPATGEKKDQDVTRNASADYTPATPTTDKAGVTTGVYNNPLVTSSDWIKMTHGDAIGYYTAKAKMVKHM